MERLPSWLRNLGKHLSRCLIFWGQFFVSRVERVDEGDAEDVRSELERAMQRLCYQGSQTAGGRVVEPPDGWPRIVGEGDVAENAAASYRRNEKNTLPEPATLLRERLEQQLFTLLSSKLPLETLAPSSAQRTQILIDRSVSPIAEG